MAKSKEKKADCPNCGTRVSLKEPVKVGTKVECPDCGEKLEVISLAPELDYAYEEWEEESEEEEEEDA